MEFCSYFEQIADSPNFLRKLALEFCLRPKSLKLRHSSNWAANLFKIWQNSNASLSVAYLFFIIYLKSIEWTIHKIGKFKVVCMFYCIGIYNKHCLSLPKLKNDNIQHTHPLKFFNLVIVHTLDFWYMIKNK